MRLLSVLRRVRFPDPLTLLTLCVLLGAAASWVVPAGQYARHEDAVTGRMVVVPDTYAAVDPAPVGLFEALLAIPRGLIAAADIIFLVFLTGGAFVVVDRTGALRAAVDALARALGARGIWVIPVVSLFFATGGVLMNTQEEIIALMPVLAAAGVRYDRWLRFALPLWGLLAALGASAIVIGIATGLD